MPILEILWIKCLIASLTIIPFVVVNYKNWRQVKFPEFFHYTVLIFFPASLILLNIFDYYELWLFIFSYYPLFYLSAEDLRRLEVTIYPLFIGISMHLIWVLNIFLSNNTLYIFFQNAFLIGLIILSIKVVENLQKKTILGNADPIIIVISILGLSLEQSILWLFLVASMPIILFWKVFKDSLSAKIPFIPFCVSAKLIVVLIYSY